VRQGKTGMLDFFFEDYIKYNKHTPIEFMDWLETVYDHGTDFAAGVAGLERKVFQKDKN